MLRNNFDSFCHQQIKMNQWVQILFCHVIAACEWVQGYSVTGITFRLQMQMLTWTYYRINLNLIDTASYEHKICLVHRTCEITTNIFKPGKKRASKWKMKCQFASSESPPGWTLMVSSNGGHPICGSRYLQSSIILKSKLKRGMRGSFGDLRAPKYHSPHKPNNRIYESPGFMFPREFKGFQQLQNVWNKIKISSFLISEQAEPNTVVGDRRLWI